MKWLFRIIGLTILGFLLLCVVGAFMPAQQRVDSTRVINADVLTVYEIVSDLQSYPEWTGLGGPDSEWVFGGADFGTGQTAAWQSGQAFGSVEILQTEPGQFILIQTIDPLGEQTVTLALSEADIGTHFLIEAKRELGGFPFIGRVASLRQKGATQQLLDSATDGLQQMLE